MTYDFASRFTKLSGIVHHVASEDAAAATIAELCLNHRRANCIALAGLAPAVITGIETRCPDIDILKEPYDRASLPLAIDRAAIGITGIHFAIAQSGTMVEVADNDAARLVSSLPRVHIGVLHAADIIDGYFESAARIRDIINRYPAHVVISFISGPSRTGDIELKLTLGVHGPEEAHCVIIAPPT